MNIVVNFRGVNQCMHDKTFIVDGKLAITGGRNMAAEYFDYNQQYNFRDRDALLLGDVAKQMQASFEKFWHSPLSAPVEDLYDGLGLMQKHVTVKNDEIHFKKVQILIRKTSMYPLLSVIILNNTLL